MAKKKRSIIDALSPESDELIRTKKGLKTYRHIQGRMIYIYTVDNNGARALVSEEEAQTGEDSMENQRGGAAGTALANHRWKMSELPDGKHRVTKAHSRSSRENGKLGGRPGLGAAFALYCFAQDDESKGPEKVYYYNRLPSAIQARQKYRETYPKVVAMRQVGQGEPPKYRRLIEEPEE